MVDVSIAFTFSAFIAGVLMFLAPCTLPLVPAYLAFISGVKAADLVDESTAKVAHRKIIVNGLFFVCGFSIVFIVFGVLAGAAGSQIGQFRSLLSQLGGIFIIIFGLMMLGILNISILQKEYKLTIPHFIKPGHPSSSFLIGTIFALGWTPCVGPVLASVILLATDSTTLVSGGLLLAIFSLGLAIPFLCTALLYAHVEKTIIKYSRASRFVSVTGGVFLIAIGILLLTENFELTVVYGYKVFELFHFDALYNYL